MIPVPARLSSCRENGIALDNVKKSSSNRSSNPPLSHLPNARGRRARSAKPAVRATWIIIKINVNVINIEEVRSRSQRVATVVIGQLDKERILDDSTPFWLCKKASMGRWQALYWQDERVQSAGTFATKADAQACLSAMETDLRRGKWIDPRGGQVTLDNYANEWLQQRTDLAERTLELYRHVLASTCFQCSAPQHSLNLVPPKYEPGIPTSPRTIPRRRQGISPVVVNHADCRRRWHCLDHALQGGRRRHRACRRKAHGFRCRDRIDHKSDAGTSSNRGAARYLVPASARRVLDCDGRTSTSSTT